MVPADHLHQLPWGVPLGLDELPKLPGEDAASTTLERDDRLVGGSLVHGELLVRRILGFLLRDTLLVLVKEFEELQRDLAEFLLLFIG